MQSSAFAFAYGITHMSGSMAWRPTALPTTQQQCAALLLNLLDQLIYHLLINWQFLRMTLLMRSQRIDLPHLKMPNDGNAPCSRTSIHQESGSLGSRRSASRVEDQPNQEVQLSHMRGDASRCLFKAGPASCCSCGTSRLGTSRS